MDREALCASLLPVFSCAAAVAATRASFAEERYKDHLSVSHQSAAGMRVVKRMTALAARDVQRKKKDLKKHLEKENSKQTMGSNINMALQQCLHMQPHRTACKSMLVEPTAKSDALLMLAEEALRVSPEPVLTAFKTQLPIPLLGSEQAVSLGATLASSTGKSRTIVVNLFFDLNMLCHNFFELCLLSHDLFSSTWPVQNHNNGCRIFTVDAYACLRTLNI